MAHGQMTATELKHHVRVYIGVFTALLFLTLVTVGVSYLRLPTAGAVAVALAVALTKGSLVALFFMHLSNEKRIIYGTLAITGALFLVLMTIGFY